MKRTILLVTCALVAVCASRSQNAAELPAFDAASLKIANRKAIRSVSGTMKGGPGTGDPGRITYTQIGLHDLLATAWDMENYRIIAPDWLDRVGSDFYTITATMPPGTSKQQFQLMLQNLLIERFKLKYHHETRVFPGYELVVAAGGQKLKESSNPDAPDPLGGDTGKLDADGFLVLPPGHGQGISVGNGVHVKCQNFTMAEFVASTWLQRFVGEASVNGRATDRIVDSTNLSGKYDFTLKFDNHANAAVAIGAGVRGNSLPDEASASSLGSGLPNIFTAIERQLGLKLVKTNGFKLDSIVIDDLAKVPTDD